jgi:hypothetical protein
MQLPLPFDGCTCKCHSVAGVYHVVACCWPSIRPKKLFPEDMDDSLDELSLDKPD